MNASAPLDPITYEVLKHRLWQINDEQGAAIKTISASPIVVEGNDYNVGLFTAEGRLVTAGIGSMVHVTTLGTTIESIRARAGTIADGDAFLTNDPYLGALHQNDVIVASPLFWDGAPVLWVGNVLHHADVGGIDSGSFCINARSLYQEPPRYFLKVVDRGTLSPEVEHTFVTNSRLPDTVALDLRAQVGAIHVVKERLRALIAEQGLAPVLETMRLSLAYAEQQIRARLRELPEGEWTAEAFMDGERVGSERILRVCVRLTKTDDRLRFDYAGSDPQVDAAVNSTYHATYAGSAVPIYAFLCGGEIDWNDGLKPCLDVVAPEGSVVNARFPAPVSICTVGFRWLATVAAANAVSQMCAASDRYRDRVCSSWNVSSNCVNLFGQDARGRAVGALLSDHRAGGAAGRSFGDGFSFAGQITSFSSNLGNVENAEWKLPILYVFRRQLQDSGGPGTYRGGLTAAAAVVPYETGDLVYKLTNTAGTDQSNAAGLAGGFPGAGSQVTILRDTRLWERYGASAVPLAYADFGGAIEHQPSKADGVLGPRDVLVFYPPGGGGYGDPLDREPARVAADVVHGRVSATAAADIYGVVVAPDGRLDELATAQRRATLRAARLPASPPPNGPTGNGSTRPPDGQAQPRLGPRLTAYLALAPDDPARVCCARCGTTVGSVDAPLAQALVRFAPLRAAGPWLAVRWDGESPNFALQLTICPGCAALLDTREVRRAAPGEGATAAPLAALARG